MALAEQFLQLFAGLQRSHGIYVVPAGAQGGGKGKLHNTSWARTVQKQVTEQLWEQHLVGTIGLGIVPIRDDATCLFGAVDVDVYPLDLKALAVRVHTLGLPLICCRTKSGGAHLYLFLSEPTPPPLLRAKLREFSNALGFKPDTEIFPKQERLTSDSAGSWINMPYQAGSRSTRYALGPDGNALTPEQFIEYAHAKAITQDQLTSFEITTEDNDDFEGGPPCLQTLAVKGFGNWQNNGLFSIAVFLRKKYGDAWTSHLNEYNQRYLDPPCSEQEVKNVIKSINKKKGYFYKCKDEPICSVCDKKTCKTREFGIGQLPTSNGLLFGPLTKIETDPPTYVWAINNTDIKLSVKELTRQNLFHDQIIHQLDIWPIVIQPTAWRKIVEDALANIKTVPVPDDATHEGQFWEHVQAFCTSRAIAKSWDEMLLHKPYTENGITHFCAIDLLQFLHQKKFNSIDEKIIYIWMLTKGVKHHERVLKGKPTKYWSIPAFPEQTQEHAVPRAPLPERM